LRDQHLRKHPLATIKVSGLASAPKLIIKLALVKPKPKISVKNYMSPKVGWVVDFFDWVDAFIRHSFIE
jgi:hypothetical protein